MVLILLYPVLGHLNLGSLPYLPQRPPFISGPCSSLLALCHIHLNINTFFSIFKKKKKIPESGILGFKLPNSFYFRPRIFLLRR